MTKILSSLEGGGWIARTAHAEDRRQSVISITEEGIRLLDEDTRARDEWLASQLQRFSTEECDVLSKAIDVLDRLGSG